MSELASLKISALFLLTFIFAVEKKVRRHKITTHNTTPSEGVKGVTFQNINNPNSSKCKPFKAFSLITLHLYFNFIALN